MDGVSAIIVGDTFINLVKCALHNIHFTGDTFQRIHFTILVNEQLFEWLGYICIVDMI